MGIEKPAQGFVWDQPSVPGTGPFRRPPCRRRRRLPAVRTVALSPERPPPVARRRRRRQRPVHFFALSSTSVTSFRFFPVSCFPARSTSPAGSDRASVSACAPFVPARAPVPVIGSARAPCPSSPARRHRPRLEPRHIRGVTVPGSYLGVRRVRSHHSPMAPRVGVPGHLRTSTCACFGLGRIRIPSACRLNGSTSRYAGTMCARASRGKPGG